MYFRTVLLLLTFFSYTAANAGANYTFKGGNNCLCVSFKMTINGFGGKHVKKVGGAKAKVGVPIIVNPGQFFDEDQVLRLYQSRDKNHRITGYISYQIEKNPEFKSPKSSCTDDVIQKEFNTAYMGNVVANFSVRGNDGRFDSVTSKPGIQNQINGTGYTFTIVCNSN